MHNRNELEVSLIDEATGIVVFAPATSSTTSWTYLVEALVSADKSTVTVILLVLPVDGAEQAASAAGPDYQEAVGRRYLEDALKVLRLT